MDVLASIRDEARAMIKSDPAHDFAHTMRVYKNAKKICRKENANQKLVLSAVLLHDIVSLPKTGSNSKLSAARSACISEEILQRHGFASDEIQTVSDAICDHSFSGGKTPSTIEGKILQDADRLDALGAVGIARAFAVSGSLGRSFYAMDDPFCRARTPNDKLWTLDHFYSKLLKLEQLMNTEYGRQEAARRTKILHHYIKCLKEEI